MRPVKNNLDYFSHDNSMRNDRKIKALRGKFGLAGYAVYNMLLESISEEDLLLIKWDEINIDMLAGDFGVQSDDLSNMVEYMTLIGLLQIDNGHLKCEQLERRAAPVFEKRGRFLDSLRVSAPETIVSAPETTVSAPESTQSKVKESKEEKRKVKHSKETTARGFSPPDYLVEVWSDFLEVCKKQRKPKTIRAQELATRTLDKLAPEDQAKQVAIVEQSIERGWTGLFPLADTTKKTAQRYGREEVSMEVLAEQMKVDLDKPIPGMWIPGAL